MTLHFNLRPFLATSLSPPSWPELTGEKLPHGMPMKSYACYSKSFDINILLRPTSSTLTSINHRGFSPHTVESESVNFHVYCNIGFSFLEWVGFHLVSLQPRSGTKHERNVNKHGCMIVRVHRGTKYSQIVALRLLRTFWQLHRWAS